MTKAKKTPGKAAEADALYHLGIKLLAQQQAQAAIEHFSNVLAIQPAHADAMLSMGNAYYYLEKFDDAIKQYQKAATIRPNYGEAYHNLALAFVSKRDYLTAIEHYRKALCAKPDHAAAETGLAGALLKTGQLHEGWRHFEKRWEGFQNSAEGTLNRPATTLPQWRGEQVDKDAGLLLFCEQGLGDSLQFVRYLPMLAKFFSHVTLVCQTELVSLLRESFSGFGILVTDRPPDNHSAWQWHCTTLSLPFAFDTTLENLPANIPYLKAPQQRIDYWQKQLSRSTPADKARVGLVWSGGKQLIADSQRSMAPARLLPLLANQNVSWLSLQKSDTAAKGSPFKATNLIDYMDEIQDFADTAALIENLDLVISVDTAVAHLAGALGKPVWLLNRFDGDWRWMIGREDSPWYPRMRLFNQRVVGDWDEVLARVSDALDMWLANSDSLHKSSPSDDEMNAVITLFNDCNWPALEQEARKLCLEWPQHGFAWKCLGVSLKMQRRDDDAIEAMKKAVELMPEDSDAHNNLAAALREKGQLDAAVEHLQTALQIRPDYPDALNSLGISLRLRGEIEQAIALYRQAISIKPDYHEAHFNLANTLRDRGELDEALTLYAETLRLKPDYAPAYNGIGIVRMMQNAPDAALLQFQKALDIAPNLPEALNGIGNALRALGDNDKAITYYHRALELYPDYHDVYHNIAISFREKNDLNGAIQHYSKALELKPDYASAAAGMGMALLSQGNLHEGWRYYEKRWDGFLQTSMGTLKRPNTSLPQWLGEEPDKAAALLLFCEQGLGDSLQFIRYLPLLSKRFARITVVCPPALMHIFRGSFQAGNIDFTANFPSDHSPWQWHCNLLSLPMAFNTTLQNLPANVPYLKSPENRQVYWQNRLEEIGAKAKPCVGLVWAGGSLLKDDSKRSILPIQLENLISNQDISWISLQKFDASEKKAKSGLNGKLIDWMDEIEDFADTAALIDKLDLVISVDTSVAHLAGALAKPVWLLNRYSGDWRWIVGREDSPWYPSMKIFSQKTPGDWDAVLRRVAADLQAGSGLPESFHARSKYIEKRHPVAIPRPASKPLSAEVDAIVRLFNTKDWPALEQAATLLTERYPADGFGFNSLGVALQMQQKHEHAIKLLREAAKLMPDDFEVHNNLANTLKTRNPDEAVRHYKAALKIKPDYVEALQNLGITLRDSGRLKEAIACFKQALSIRPDYAETHHHLGIALDANKQLEAAIASYQQALAIKPDYPEALHNAANAHYHLGHYQEALEYYRRVLDIVPGYAESRWNRSLILLAYGQFEQGWQDYDLRFQRKKPTALLETPYPRWLGSETLAGKKLLIQFEQGVGDALQMLRYVNLLEQQGASCWIQAPHGMHSLLARSFSKATIIDHKVCPMGLDFRIPVMSLPLALQTLSEAAIPKQIPYLLADSKKIARWGKKLAGRHTHKVGLAWRGNPEHQNDYNRSISLVDLLPLVKSHPSIQFVSLQKNLTSDELGLLQGNPNLHVLDKELTDFDDTAAVMANLDLVICIDSAPAHLAGALGRPVWLLLPHRADWRWMLQREDSPWYPTMSLFRQKAAGDWSEVLARVSSALDGWPVQNLSGQALAGSTYAQAVEHLLELFNNGQLEALAQASADLSNHYPDDAFAANMQAMALALQPGQDLSFIKDTVFKLLPAGQARPLSARTLRDVQGVEEAIGNFATAIEEKQDFAESLHRLAATLLVKSNNSGAITYYLRVVALKPAFVEAWLNLATACLRKGEPENALKNYRQALSLRTDDAYALNGIGAALKDLNRLDEAIAYFRQALSIDPQFAAAETGLGLTLLMMGQLREGWLHYEKRWQGLNIAIQGDIKRPETSLPQWRGELVSADARLLIFCEQGLGDTLQFIRYAILARQKFAGVTVICPPPLINILRGSLQNHGIEVETKVPSDQTAWQWHCNTMSLPLAFDTTLDNIPTSVPYLTAPANRIEYWKNRLAPLSPPGKPRIGLVWAANQDNIRLRSRSMSFSKIAPLIQLDGFSWVSLQKEKVEAFSKPLQLIDWMDEIEDLADTAALIENLDLVISIDTSVAHLAGALAKPVWLLTRFESDWRWMLGRDDSPWYPSMHIFTQQSSGNWDELISRIAAALQNWPQQSFPAANGRPSMTEMQAIVSIFGTANWLELERLASDLCQRYPYDGFGYKSLGVALKMQGKNAQALDLMRKAADIMPEDADAHNNLAASLKDAGDIAGAITHFEAAIRIKPDFVEALNNLGMVFYDQAQPEKAIGYFHRALEFNPDSAVTLFNLGIASRELGRNVDAINYYQRSLANRPNDVETLWNMSLAMLSCGQFEPGWEQYEIRFARPGKKPLAQTPYPCWLGKEPISGKKILIQSEQGLGDALQMLRYVKLLEQQGAECWIQTFRTLHDIVSRSFPKAKIVDENTCPDGLDYRIPLMSLPLAMQSFSEQSIPKAVPYLLPDKQRVSYWQQQLSASRPAVGLVWRGNPNNSNDNQRSIPLSKFLPLLAAHPSIQFLSLQKDLTASEHDMLKAYKNLRILDSELTDFDETAAILGNLDMLISVDSAPVHLSGAMGRPTWLLLSFKVDWRWLAGRNDSPWYPGMRIFHQASVGDWGGVIAEVNMALDKEFAKKQYLKQ